eukprot:COSAG01_NODE_3306_length_6291_cov_15.294574_1_plen_115_part_00
MSGVIISPCELLRRRARHLLATVAAVGTHGASMMCRFVVVHCVLCLLFASFSWERGYVARRNPESPVLGVDPHAESTAKSSIRALIGLAMYHLHAITITIRTVDGLRHAHVLRC